jgi:uncharacterized hydrophobic protein (TIGR00341 family)
MALRVIEINCPADYADTVTSVAEQTDATNINAFNMNDGDRYTVRILARPEQQQPILDIAQKALGSCEDWRIIVLPVEAALPPPKRAKDDDGKPKKPAEPGLAPREELYEDILGGARVNLTYVALVVLSTVVAALGLTQNDAAVIIGAMVIAPLLGPNLAFSFATVLGDSKLMLRAGVTNLVGVGLVLACAFALGSFIAVDVNAAELMRRTDVGLGGIAVALASGAAAVLSLTTRLSANLVGVMVAVALLPPTASIGMMLAAGRFDLALGATTLLAVNIVCINLSAQAVFLISGLRPRLWAEKIVARRSVLVSAGVWCVLLAMLVAVIWVRHRL